MLNVNLILACLLSALVAACASRGTDPPAIVDSETARQVAAEAVRDGESAAEAISKSEQVEAPK